jgi:O-antigen/teichoic acid export membrane protein
MWREIISQARRIREKGSFIRNVSIASSWNTAIIITQILLSPVITRIFGPAEYSVFALYNSIVANLALFGNLRYSEAMVLADTPARRDNLILLSFSLINIVTLIALVGVALGRDWLAAYFQTPITPDFLYLIPLGVWLSCVVDLAITINIRRKQFVRNGLTGFTMNVSARLANIAYGLGVGARGVGLILGDIAGKIFGLVVILPAPRKIPALWQSFRSAVSFASMKEMAVRYKSFPLYFFPSSFILYLSGHLPVFFFQWQFGGPTVGSYALASSMLEIFNRLVPYALAPMVLQKINEFKQQSLDLMTARVYRLFTFLLLTSFVIFSMAALLSGVVFEFVFGEAWRDAGRFASILALFYSFNFLSVALMEVYNVMEKQKHLLAYSITNIFLRVMAFGAILVADMESETGLLVFAVACALGSILQIAGVFHILMHKFWKVLILLMTMFGILTIIILITQFSDSSITGFLRTLIH